MKFYRLLFASLIIFLLLMSESCLRQEKTRLVLTSKKEARYVVVTGSEEGPVVQYAALELCKYLKQISGDTFSVQHDTISDLPRIIIGFHNPLSEKNAKKILRDSIRYDGFHILNIGKDIYITGNIDRGTLYGVYYFLDHYLGVRWFSPTFAHIPSLREISLTLPLNDLQNPRFAYREIFAGSDDGYYRQHNLLNGNRFHRSDMHYDPGIDTWSHFVPGGPPPRHGGHNFYEVVPSPACHHGGQLLAMSSRCRSEAVDYFLHTIANHGTGYWYGFTQNDNGWDPDPASLRFAQAHGNALSAPVIDMVLDVAGQVRKQFPDARFATYAYQFSFKPPSGMNIPDYLLIEAAPIHADFGRPFTDPVNAEIDSSFRGWNRIAGNLGIWTYITNFQNYLQPLPNIFPMCENIQYLARLPHMKTYFGQGAYGTTGGEFTELRTWVSARLLWNPDQDYKALIREFTKGYYGPAGKYIQQYIDLLHRSFLQHRERISSKQRITSEYLDLPFILQADSLMRLADSVAGGKYAPQVHQVRMGVDMTILLRRAWYKEEARKQGITWHPDPQRRKRLEKYCREAGITEYNEDTPISGLFTALDIDRKYPTTPEIVRGKKWIDFQDLDFNICCGARLVEDSLASDNGAIRYSGKEWAIQMKLDMLPPEGKWTLYANVRCETKAGSTPAATAFCMGVYPGGEITHAIREMRDGKYHLIAFPNMPVSYQTGRHLWFCTGGEGSTLYIDRVIAVREQ